MKNLRKRYKNRLINPAPTSCATSNSMRGNRARDTKPELRLRKQLWGLGARGYRVHPESMVGRQDIAFPRAKVAVFVNGCFWHRCPNCRLPLPQSNRKFWATKFRRNTLRDQRKRRELEQLGWRVVTVWECELSQSI